MYVCEVCSTPFDSPAIVFETISDGEHTWQERFEVCPVCCEGHFAKVDDCPICADYKLSTDILCRPCRQVLLNRFVAFADELTAEQEEQLDAWLDGDTITNRRKWK